MDRGKGDWLPFPYAEIEVDKFDYRSRNTRMVNNVKYIIWMNIVISYLQIDQYISIKAETQFVVEKKMKIKEWLFQNQ